MNSDDPLPTRASLIAALKDPNDHARWVEFQRTYRALLVGISRRAALPEDEVEEAVQETFIAVARRIAEFNYNAGRDSFKGWLLQIVRWKIADQFRKRDGRAKRHAPSDDDQTQISAGGSSIDAVDQPDPTANFDIIWEREWQQFRVREALASIKREVNPAHYAMYHLHVLEQRPAAEVASLLRVNIAQIYLAKHRVGSALKKALRAH